MIRATMDPDSTKVTLKVGFKTLPEAQRTQDIESKT